MAYPWIKNKVDASFPAVQPTTPPLQTAYYSQRASQEVSPVLSPIARQSIYAGKPSNEKAMLDEETKARVMIDTKKESRMKEIKDKAIQEMSQAEKSFQTDCLAVEQHLTKEKRTLEQKLAELDRLIQALSGEKDRLKNASGLVAEGDIGMLEKEVSEEEARFVQESATMEDRLNQAVNPLVERLNEDFGVSKNFVKVKQDEVLNKLVIAMDKL